jgi:adenylate kinase
LGQAQAFDENLTKHGLADDVLVLQLDLSEDKIRERVQDRLTCRACGATFGAKFHQLEESSPCPVCQGQLERRNDDTMEALEQRLVQYREYTLPVCDFYAKSHRLIAIDASQTREEIHRSVCEAVTQEAAV